MPPPESDFRIASNAPEIQRYLLFVPEAFNPGLNRALRSIGGVFSRQFTAKRLGKEGVEIKRGGIAKGRRGKDQPALPARMQRAGFKGEIVGTSNLEQKALHIRSRSSVMLAHQFGAVIRPKRTRNLKIRLPIQGSKPSQEQLQEAFVLKEANGQLLLVTHAGGTGARSRERLVVLAVLVPQVTIKASLNFLEDWQAFEPEAFRRLDKSAVDTTARLNRGKSGGLLGGSEDAA